MLSKSFFLYYFVLSFVENGLVQILIAKLNNYSNLLKVCLPQISKEKKYKKILVLWLLERYVHLSMYVTFKNIHFNIAFLTFIHAISITFRMVILLVFWITLVRYFMNIFFRLIVRRSIGV